MNDDIKEDIREVRAMLAPINPCPPGGLAGAGRDATGRAAFARVTASGAVPGARRGFRPRRAGVRLVAVGGLAVAIAAGATVAQNLGGTDENGDLRPIVPGLPAGPAANAQAVLHKAADAARHRPFTAPRPDQWAFLETRYRRIDKPGTGQGRSPGSRPRTQIDQSWTRADGKKVAVFENGRLVVSNTGGATPPQDYAGLAALPRDPDALLAHVRGLLIPGDRETGAFQVLGSILGNSVLPPAQEAAIYRAMAKIPGVELNRRAVDVQGRPALSVSLVIEGWLKYEVLLDPATYAYRGHRATAIEDHVVDEDLGSMIGKGTVESESVRIAAGFVDRPGQRP